MNKQEFSASSWRSTKVLIWCVYLLNMSLISAWWWPQGVETCSCVNQCFINFCFDGLSVYLLFIFQHSGMHNFKIYGFCWELLVKSLTFRLLMSYIYIYMEHQFLMFLDHTQRRTTVGRTLLDEWSARRRDPYLTTHDTHNRQISMPPVWIRTHDLSRWAAAGWSLVQRSPTDCGASLCVT